MENNNKQKEINQTIVHKHIFVNENSNNNNSDNNNIIGENKSPKSHATTLILAMFLGFLGIHRFYSGKIITAIVLLGLYLLNRFYSMFLDYAVAVWIIVDVIMIALGKFKDGKKRYIKWNYNFNEKFIITNASSKSNQITFFLCYFLGWLSIHRFYVSKIFSGIMQLVLTIIAIILMLLGVIYIYLNNYTGIGLSLLIVSVTLILVRIIWGIIDIIKIACGNFKDGKGKIILWK